MKRGKLLKTTFITLMVCATAGTLFACGGDKEYKVVYLGGEGATGDAPAEATYKEGDKFNLATNTFTKANHTFKGWSDGTSTYLEGVEYTMGTADVTFTALWEENSAPITYTVTYALGDHAASDATVPSAVGDLLANAQVTLPNAPKAAEGYEFTGWKVGSDSTLKKAGDKITVTANVTVTAQWKAKEVTPPVDDKYVTDTEVGAKILNWWTNGSLGYYVGDGEELTVQAVISKDNPDAWTGVMADIALNDDFYRFRPDHWVWTNNLIHDAVANPDAKIERVEPLWNDDTVAAYKALFADSASVIQVIKVSLKDNVVTYTVTSYAGTDTELTTPVVSATSKVTSKTDITEIQPFFYADGGAVISAASAKYAKASNTFVNLTFDFDTEGVENAVVPMRPGKADYVFGVDPTKAGYTFGGWKSSDESDTTLYKNTDTVPVTVAVTYTAQWTVAKYTVTYVLGGNAAETATAPEAVSDKLYGDKINLPDAPAAAAGYEFDGWKVGDATELKAPATEIEITGDVTITAIFKGKEEYTATYKSGDHAAEADVTVGTETVFYDDAEVTLPVAPDAATGYEFAGWKVGDDAALKQSGDKITLTANTDIVAQWKAIKYTVTFNVGEHAAEGATVAPMKADYNTEITLPAGPTEATGYSFTGWKVGTSDTVKQAGDKITVTANVTVTAQWVSTENSWTVTFLANEGDQTAHSTQTVAKDATGAAKKLVLPTTNAPTKDGYRLLGWYLSTDDDKTVLTNETLPDVTANMTVIAKWQAVFTVTVLDDLEGDAVNGAKTSYDNNGTGGTAEKFVAPTGVEKTGYTLAGWFEVVDNEGTKEYGSEVTADTEITKSMTVAAKWNEIKYTVTYALGEHAAATATVPAAVEVTHNVGKVTLPAAPAAETNYAFKGWKVGDATELSAAGAEIDVTADVTITAEFGFHVEIGTPDHTLAWNGQPDAWKGKINAGDIVELSGTMTSAATGNFQTAHMYIWDTTPNLAFRMDWAVNYLNNAGTDGNTSTCTPDKWTITKSIGPKWTEEGGEQDKYYRDSIKDCNITMIFDWSDEKQILIKFNVVNKTDSTITNTMVYTITPQEGNAFEKQTYNIGLNGEGSYTVIDKITITERNDNPTTDNPLIINSVGYAPIGYKTEISKGEKIVFSGTSSSTSNLNWFAPLVSLFSGSAEKLPLRADNYIIGHDPDTAEDVKTANLAAEKWEKIEKAQDNSVTGDNFWSNMCALKNNGNVEITVDWTNATTIVVTMAYTGTVNEVAQHYTQTYTITLASDNTFESYNLAIGGEGCTTTITSIVRTPAAD